MVRSQVLQPHCRQQPVPNPEHRWPLAANYGVSGGRLFTDDRAERAKNLTFGGTTALQTRKLIVVTGCFLNY